MTNPNSNTAERTPVEHRAEVAEWRAHAPANDSAIFPKRRKSAARHSGMAEGLSAYLAMISRPYAADDPDAAIDTNWRTAPANDNRVPEDGFGVERDVEVIPWGEIRSGAAIEKDLKGVEFREIAGVLEPVSGDIEWTRTEEHGLRVTRLGKLRFSDGSQKESCMIRNDVGKISSGTRVVPAGGMLGTREKSKRDKGGETDPAETAASNKYFRDLLKAKPAKPPKLKPRKVERVEMSKAEARAVLAEAYANSPDVPVQKCPDGFPASPSNIRDLFIGMKKGRCGDNGSTAWSGISTAMEDRQMWARTLDALATEYFETLTEAASANSLRELGERRGYSGKAAIDAGRRLLVAANDNLTEAMRLAEEAA